MKKLTFITILFLILLTSCDLFDSLKNDTQDEVVKIDQTTGFLGEWSQVANTFGGDQMKILYIFTESSVTIKQWSFDNNGSLVLTGEITGTYSRSGQNITLTTENYTITYEYYAQQNALVLNDINNEGGWVLQREGTTDLWVNEPGIHLGSWKFREESATPFNGYKFTETTFESYRDGVVESKGTYTVDGYTFTFDYTHEFDNDTNTLVPSTRESETGIFAFYNNKLLIFPCTYETQWYQKVE